MEWFGLIGGPGAAGATILLIFNLYLLAHWDRVRRPFFLLISVVGVLLAMGATFFMLGGERSDNGGVAAVFIVGRIFSIIGAMIAFLGSVVACYGAALPMKLPDNLSQGTTPAPPPPAAK